MTAALTVGDVLGAILHAIDRTIVPADDIATVCAGDLRNGMQIVERVHGKRRYYTVWGHPVIKGHAVHVTVSVNGHKLNWRYEYEALVTIKGEN